MNNEWGRSIPTIITEKMKEFLRSKLHENELFKYDSSRLNVYKVSEYNWFGNITASGIINLKGITDIKLKSIDSITASTNVFYDEHKIALFTIIYFNDKNIIIPDFEYILTSMNLSICESCYKHKSDCTCSDKIEKVNKEVQEIMNIMNKKNLSETRIYDPDYLLNQKEECDEETKKPEIDLVKFEPIIMGITTTLGYNKKKVEEAAIKILTSNSNITDNNLATEIMRTIKG